MSDPEPSPQSRATALAAALVARIGPLADAAADAVRGIERDQLALGAGRSSAEPEQLIETVVEQVKELEPGARTSDPEEELLQTVVDRVKEVEADCRRLAGILRGFESVFAEPTAVANKEVVDRGPDRRRPATSSKPKPRKPAKVAAERDGRGRASGEPAASVTKGSNEAVDGDPGTEPDSGEAPAGPEPEPKPESSEAPAGPEPEPAGSDGVGPAWSDEKEPAEPVHVSAGMRLLATQMSVAGATIPEIASRLDNDFGVEDVDQVIAQLFGTPASRRS